jgi:hypothetical protein
LMRCVLFLLQWAMQPNAAPSGKDCICRQHCPCFPCCRSSWLGPDGRSPSQQIA